MKGLVVIIPTYNERKNIAEFLSEVLQRVPEATILVVDDNSPDGTGTYVSERAKKDTRIRLLHRETKEGLGRAYLAAFEHVLMFDGVQKILMIDADFSHDTAYIEKLLAASDQAELIIGSRYCPGGSTEGWETWRKALSAYGNLYARTVTGMPIADTTSGFNLIDAALLRRIPLHSIDLSGYAFQMELKYILWKYAARITEVPIVFKTRREGESKISNHIIAEGLIAPWKMIFRNK